MIALGSTWAAVGFLPLFLPSIGWEPYYGLFGSLGVWLVAGTLLAGSRPATLLAIGVMCLLQPALADTAMFRFGHEGWQRYVGREYQRLHAALVEAHPSVPHHSRFFFENAPRGLSLLGVHSAAFQVWYHDTTVTADLLSRYRRSSGNTGGKDMFLYYDPERGWIELVVGPEDWVAAERRFSGWAEEHDRLGTALVQAGDFETAAREFEKLAEAYPDVAGYRVKAGQCWLWLGRRDLARAQWRAALARAAPGDPTLAPVRAALAEPER